MIVRIRGGFFLRRALADFASEFQKAIALGIRRAMTEHSEIAVRVGPPLLRDGDEDRVRDAIAMLRCGGPKDKAKAAVIERMLNHVVGRRL